MDRVDQNSEINKGNSKEVIPYPAKLYTTPYVFNQIAESTVVMFGNSGFDINFDPKAKDCTFDFIPEGSVKPVEGMGMKYSEMLGASLFELYNLLNDQEKLSEFKLDFSKTKVISALTNDSMIKVLDQIFLKSDNKDLLSVNGPFVDINLSGFKNLKNEDPLIKYLGNMSERAKSVTVNTPS